MEQEDRLDDGLVASAEDIRSLVSKGLIKVAGYDPIGRTLYQNTELGNMIAQQLEALGPEEEDLDEKDLDDTDLDDDDFFEDDDLSDVEEDLEDDLENEDPYKGYREDEDYDADVEDLDDL